MFGYIWNWPLIYVSRFIFAPYYIMLDMYTACLSEKLRITEISLYFLYIPLIPKSK